MAEKPTDRFVHGWTGEEDELLTRLLEGYDPTTRLGPYQALVAEVFLKFFNTHTLHGITRRCAAFTKEQRDAYGGKPAMPGRLPTIDELMALAGSVVAGSTQEDSPAEPAVPPQPVSVTVPVPASPMKKISTGLSDGEIQRIFSEWCRDTDMGLGVPLNSNHDAVVIEPHANGLVIGIIYEAKVFTGFVYMTHIWPHNATYYPPHYFARGDLVRAQFSGRSVRGNQFSMTKAGFKSPPIGPELHPAIEAPKLAPKPAVIPPSVPSAEVTPLDHLIRYWEEKIGPLDAVGSDGLRGVYQRLNGLHLPADEWITDGIRELAGKDAVKRHFGYFNKMIRSWLRFGKYNFALQEIEDALDLFEETSGLGASREAAAYLQKLITEHGIVRVISTMARLLSDAPKPDLSLVQAEWLEKQLRTQKAKANA